jgi:hypothetical protein
MNKVYAVWRGTYRDRDVVAIFSTEALAENYCTEYNKMAYDEARVKVYEVDAQVGYNVTKFWQTSIACDSGDIYDRYDGYTDGDIVKKTILNSRYEDHPKYIVTSSTESADHADKLAIEALQEYQRLVSQGMSYADINQLWRNAHE